MVILLIVVLITNKKDTSKEIQNNQNVSMHESVMCYSYAKENDRAWLTMKITGDAIKGEYHNLPAESDSKIGTFEGYMYPDATTSEAFADVWWYSFAEGVYVMEQLHLGFDTNGAAALFGEMIDRGDGVYVYKDTENLIKGFQMSQVDCDTLDKNVSSGSVIEIEGDNNVVTPALSEGEMVACTMDAMMCPDGSYVGRVGPNCAFQACP